MLECKTQKLNCQYEQGQPMEQTRSVFCPCNPCVVRCQSQHQCHIWRMNLMFEAYCTGKWAWQLSIKFCVVHEAMNGCKILKIHYRLALKMWIFANIVTNLCKKKTKVQVMLVFLYLVYAHPNNCFYGHCQWMKTFMPFSFEGNSYRSTC